MSTDEEKISRLYQQGNNENDERPSTQLDKAVLKAAHQAVEKPSAAKSPFSGGWPAATAIAAVLIITVILVPLIQQETPLTTSTNITDDSLELMLEQDETGRPGTENANIKAKKPSLAKEQERRITPTPKKTLRRDQQFTEEETITPMRAKTASPSTQQAKPASATAGKSTIQAYELKPELKSEPQQLNSYGLTADSASPATLTAKIWLKKIQQLIDQGELNLAQEELDSFRTYYPDEEIEASILNSFKSQPGLN